MISYHYFSPKLAQVATPFLILFIFFILLSSATFAQQQQNTPPSHANPVEIKADKLTWDWAKLKLIAKGKVSFKYGEVSLSCSQATITFTLKEESRDKTLPKLEGLNLRTIQAETEVVFKYSDFDLKAQQVNYHHEKQTLTAVGPIYGTWQSHRLKGQKLSINLSKKKALLNRAKLLFHLPKDVQKQSIWGR